MTASRTNGTCGGRQSLGSVAIRPILTNPRRTPSGRRTTKGKIDESSCRGCGRAGRTAAGDSQVSTGGSTEVNVDGKQLAGLDLNSVTCVKRGGKINVASGAINGQAGLAVVMTERILRPSTRWASQRDSIALLDAEIAVLT